MTDPTGRTFVSYRRSRLEEVARLVLALHDHGVPTWQDVEDLEAEPMPDELRAVLGNPSTAGAILWITPEVEDSAVIGKIEMPAIMDRAKKKDGFFLQPVAAGGLDYEEAAEKAGRYLSVENLRRWNLERVEGDPIDDAEAARIAELVLRRRIREIDRKLPPDEPLRLAIGTRVDASPVTNVAVNLRWKARFEGRIASPSAWDGRLLPALNAVVMAIGERAPGRAVEAEGLCSLPAAMALGAAFLAPAGRDLRWRQRKVGREDQVWSLSEAREEADVEVDSVEDNAASEDVAVLISINRDVEEAVRESRDLVPGFRGYVRLRGPGSGEADLQNAGQAVDAAHRTIAEIKKVQHKWRNVRRVHVFMSAPAGFAVMFGQLINGLGPVQTYEHLQQDAIGVYRRAALLRPGIV